MGAPDGQWIPIGPSAVRATGARLGGQITSIAVSVSINAVAPPYQNAMFLGTAFGGVWRSTKFTSSDPVWVPLTDYWPSLSARDRAGSLWSLGRGT